MATMITAISTIIMAAGDVARKAIVAVTTTAVIGITEETGADRTLPGRQVL